MKKTFAKLRRLQRASSHEERLSTSELPDRYYRLLMIGGGVVVSSVIVLAAIIVMVAIIWRFFYSTGLTFLSEQRHVQDQINTIQNRSDEETRSDEMLWSLLQHDRNQLPTKRYLQLLEKNQGVVNSQPDITIVPFTLLAKTSTLAEDEYLSEVLRLARNISAYPIIDKNALGKPKVIHIYSADQNFLMIWPTLSEAELRRVKQQGVEAFIDGYVDKIDQAIEQLPSPAQHEQHGVWVSTSSSAASEDFAIPLHHDGKRVAVTVVSFSDDRFLSNFNSLHHRSGFFVISKDRHTVFGYEKLSSSMKRNADTVLARGLDPNHTDEGSVHYKSGVFFYYKAIRGPDWIAVYAFDWAVFFESLKSAFLIVALATLLVLSALWVFIVLLNRLVLGPLREHARQVYESEAFNRTILRTLPIGLAVFDYSSDRVVLQNDITRELLAGSGEGDGFYRRVLEEYASILNAAQTISRDAKEVRVLETSVTTAAGERSKLSVAFTQTRYLQREVVLFGLSDVTEQRAAVALLEKAREAADQANAAKSMFLAMMSHEIRTPLHGALGNLELLALEKLSHRQQLRVTTVRQAFESLLSMINDVLDLSKLEANEMRLCPEPFHLDDLLENCAQTFAPIILDSGLNFTCLVDPRISGVWIGDRHRISQVLMNLISNARKFTQAGSITLRALPAEVTEEVTWVRFLVSDTGIGISEKHQAHIFEPFVQADRTITSRFGGTGLGLTLCKRVTTLMGGTISVDSELDEGSIFTVNLALRRDPQFPLTNTPVEHGFESLTILCDSLLWQQNLIRQMQQWLPGVRLIEAHPQQPVAASGPRAVLLFAALGQAMPEGWREINASYLDTLTVSAVGPLYPERREGELHVTSLATPMLKLALSACGNRDEVFEQYADPNASDQVACSNIRVLVVEDDLLNRTLLEHQLDVLGYRHVDSATDGKEGLERCLNTTYDIIVSDFGMPVMDGQMFLSALRELNIHTPVILNTAETGGDILIKGSGFADILHKPITIERLRIALDQVLGSDQGEQRGIHCDSLKLGHQSDMRAAFLVCWPLDEQTLRDALEAKDTQRFLARLHRLKGALLVLGEKSAVEISDQLKQHIELLGLLQAQEQISHFFYLINDLVKGWPQHPSAIDNDHFDG